MITNSYINGKEFNVYFSNSTAYELVGKKMNIPYSMIIAQAESLNVDGYTNAYNYTLLLSDDNGTISYVNYDHVDNTSYIEYSYNTLHTIVTPLSNNGMLWSSDTNVSHELTIGPGTVDDTYCVTLSATDTGAIKIDAPEEFTLSNGYSMYIDMSYNETVTHDKFVAFMDDIQRVENEIQEIKNNFADLLNTLQTKVTTGQIVAKKAACDEYGVNISQYYAKTSEYESALKSALSNYISISDYNTAINRIYSKINENYEGLLSEISTSYNNSIAYIDSKTANGGSLDINPDLYGSSDDGSSSSSDDGSSDGPTQNVNTGSQDATGGSTG